jgi:hypothetical protein
MAGVPKPRERTNVQTPAYSEPTPMSRQEVLEKDREQDERRRERKAGEARAATKAKQRVFAQGPKPLTQEEIDEMEAERIAVKREREAAEEERLVRRRGEIAAGENARNGRGRGITVRA